MSKKVNIYNIGLFKRLLRYVKSYKHIFIISIFSVFGLSIFGALRPVILEKIVDENLTQYSFDFFLQYILLMVLLLVLEVISNYSFIFNAGLLGQSVVKDIRVKLFNHIQAFKMKYSLPNLDSTTTCQNSSLITRTYYYYPVIHCCKWFQKTTHPNLVHTNENGH